MANLQQIKAKIKQADKDISTMNLIMRNCYNDEGYRNYSNSLDRFIKNKLDAEKELEQYLKNKRK